MDNKNLTPASNWKRNYEDGIEVEMPSGEIVRMRPTVDTSFLLATGKIPDSLTQLAIETINIDFTEDNAPAKIKDAHKKMDEIYRVVCTETWIHPRVTQSPKGNDEIAFEWITREQKEYTMALINQPVSEWKRFLSKWSASLELVPNGTADTASPKQVTQGKPVG